MARERLLSRDKEKRRKELELSGYSHNLSHTILTMEGKAPLGNTLPEPYVASFQKGSLRDRASYWQKETPQANFGEQMLTWLGVEKGKPGMTDWLEKQKDPDVINMLKEVGLAGTQESLVAGLKEKKVADLISVINTDLQKSGKSPFTMEELTTPDAEAYARSLIFYATYLNPMDKSTTDTRSLIDTLTAYASRESNGNAEAAIEKLQKIAPLLQVAGEEGQHVLGALMVAKTHLQDGREKLHEAESNKGELTDNEKGVLDFLKKHREYEMPAALESGKSHSIEEVFRNLEPDASKNSAYWVERDIPKDFSESLTTEQVRSLEIKKPFFILNEETKRMVPNLEVFDSLVLQDNLRYVNAKALTENNSGIFALSAAGAATAERQAALYKTLSEVVLRTHAGNPELLHEFLRSQTPESLERFGFLDWMRSGKIRLEKYRQLSEPVFGEFKEKFGRPFNPNDIRSPEEQEFIAQKGNEIGQQYAEFSKDVLQNFNHYPDRLVSLEVLPIEDENLLEQFSYHVNIPRTIDAWPERIAALQEVFKQDAFTLTPEQIRQVEFLAHSVDIQKLMTWLQSGSFDSIDSQQTVQIDTTPPPAPVEDEVMLPQEEVKMTKSATLDTFFTNLSAAEANLPETVTPRRQEVLVADSSKLLEFDMTHENPLDYEIANEDKQLEIFSLDANASLGDIPYNTRNPFLATLTQENSLSYLALTELLQLGFGQNTLLAYAFEADLHPEGQARLTKNLFLQAAKIYEADSSIGERMKEYLTTLSKANAGDGQVLEEVSGNIERLFGNSEQTAARLKELTGKLQENQELRIEDYYDVGTYALPFNLQTIAQRMQLAYRMNEASENT